MRIPTCDRCGGLGKLREREDQKVCDDCWAELELIDAIEQE